MYFDKFRGTALGVMSLGGTVSGFVCTKLLHFLKETYNFRNGLLLLGALCMNLNPLTYLIKVPRWHDALHHKPTKSASSSTSTVYARVHSEEVSESATGGNGPEGPGFATRFLQDVKFLMCCPKVYMVVVSHATTIFIDYTFLSTFMDYAVDKGTSLSNAVWLTSFLAVTDAVGRICLPIVADRGYLRRSTLLMFNQLLMGIEMLLFPHVASYLGIAALTTLIAAHIGCGLILHDVLVVDYFGVERLPVIMGAVGFVKTPLVLCIPTLAGE